MKILVAGNLVNWGYNFVKKLRENGLDAELLMQKFPKKSSDPKTFEKLEEYPNWIKFWDNKKWTWKFEVIKIMKNYDLIHATTELPIFAMMSRKPYVAFPTGSDINELAFQKNLKGLLLNLAYKKSKKVILCGPVLVDSAIKLNLKNTICMPAPWINNFSKIRMLNSEKFVMFYPTRHEWKIKGNDKFLNAFVRICKETNNFKLILIKHGKDFQKSLEILEDKECENKFEVLGKTLEHKLLTKYYSEANLIIDSFPKTDGLGLIGLETLLHGKPLMSHIKSELYKKFYDEIPPIINCESEEEIYNKLKEFVNNNKKCEDIGKKSELWFKRNYNSKEIILKFKLLYEEILK